MTRSAPMGLGHFCLRRTAPVDFWGPSSKPISRRAKVCQYQGMDNNRARIMILGIGCTLFADQGFGIAVLEELERRYDFPEHVRLVDGGLLGVGLFGTICQCEHLIVIDTMCRNGRPGQIYRLQGREILARLLDKNHVQQVEFLEALAHCQVMDHPPRAVLLAVEPDDTQTLSCRLSPLLQEKTEQMVQCILAELEELGVPFHAKGKSSCA